MGETAAPGAGLAGGSGKPTIVLANNAWEGSTANNVVAQYVIEKNLGYSVNLLTIDEIDPWGKIPEFKFCAVRVEAAPEAAEAGEAEAGEAVSQAGESMAQTGDR